MCMKTATTSADLTVAMPNATQMFMGPRLYWATQTVTPVRISRAIQIIMKVLYGTICACSSDIITS